MKTQLTKVLLLICCILGTTTFTHAQDKDEKQTDLKGIWVYSVPDAPYGYQDGTIEFKNTDDKLTAIAKIGGSSYPIKEINKKDGQYSCSLYVDGSNVKITLKPAGKNKITGTAIADNWEMPVTLTPQKK